MGKCNKTKKKAYFKPYELVFWIASLLIIALAFLIFDRKSPLSLLASLVGVSSLVFNSKGNPLGQALIIVFSVFYGIISFEARYFGEMITYIGMSLPMAVIALISWIRNPFEKGKSEVKINEISRREVILALIASLFVTVAFYFILSYLGTANLIVSTLSVTTSFTAAYFTARRSSLFALFYAFNDLVLIVLWTVEAFRDSSAICVVICFLAFLVLDLYTFVAWRRMAKRQNGACES